jgi:PKD repeat protein
VAAVAGSPTDASAADDDFEWNLAEEAMGTDFDIDADATSFFMPLPNTVTFKAKALNGTPPFTFTWNFGDGSPEVSGEIVKHTYTALGTFDARATGSDASGATSVMTLRLLVTTPEEFSTQLNFDPKLLEKLPSPSPAPAVTP